MVTDAPDYELSLTDDLSCLPDNAAPMLYAVRCDDEVRANSI